MLANSLTLADDSAVNHTFDLVSREGMNSIRRETSVSSNVGSAMLIKHTLDLNAPDKVNRHLVQFNWNEIDGTTGDIYPCSVHLVISRHKSASDAAITERVHQLESFIADSTNLDELYIGGN